MKDKSVTEIFVDPEPQLQEVVPDGDRQSVNEVYTLFIGPPVEDDEDFCDDNCPRYCGCDFARRHFPQFYSN